MQQSAHVAQLFRCSVESSEYVVEYTEDLRTGVLLQSNLARHLCLVIRNGNKGPPLPLNIGEDLDVLRREFEVDLGAHNSFYGWHFRFVFMSCFVYQFKDLVSNTTTQESLAYFFDTERLESTKGFIKQVYISRTPYGDSYIEYVFHELFKFISDMIQLP